jgi:hypothetical protein
LYECQQCGALVTKDGQEKHQKSHDNYGQVSSVISDWRTRYEPEWRTRYGLPSAPPRPHHQP